ncbi:SDR family NAD(P)-dependent oxidoreductase [Aliikangiella coralliicola]|uniref:SDR family NAD(P)-dependent oxidoreductase n=1 Tax=Aliikangiella coralliicola TaxID=2592383 RepID=A0A545U642_9GAMM|nr:SDR family NAD(P)-dependent oxidoreductase [Aliikangiella coralliicola]TQV84937.1 SDR family NAD(P)-dependent oxidoreductase [Aliikangiella coralliicola]
MTYHFKDKVVWITGASSGIGKSLALKLIEEKAKVVVTARNANQLQSLYSKFDNVLVSAGDITSFEVNQNIVAQAYEIFGGIDCVILNAGSAEYIDIDHFSSQPFQRMMETNFLSIVKGIEIALPYLRVSKAPYLVGMSSSVAWMGLPQGQAYSASKAAIRNLFQGLKIELAPENIAVSWICPGFIKTPLTDKNTFPMPARITAEEAADIIYRKLCQQKTEIHLPKRFTCLLKFISMLPAGWSAKLLKGTVPAK